MIIRNNSIIPRTLRPVRANRHNDPSPSVPDLVDLTGAPLVSRESLLRSGHVSSLGVGCLTLPGSLARAFGDEEFAALNPGLYHNSNHGFRTKETAVKLALDHGLPDKIPLLGTAALVHDADPRSPGTPAKVHRTLEWMDRNEETLRHRFGWSREDFVEAQAVITRTDFPFDDKPREAGTRYDGKSPQQIYVEKLEELPSERRSLALRGGALLETADKASYYIDSMAVAIRSVRDLQGELGGNFGDWLSATHGFMNSVAVDRRADQQAAERVGAPAQFLERDQLLSSFPTFATNQAQFQAIGIELSNIKDVEARNARAGWLLNDAHNH